jgi:hypothetical protein
MGHMDASYQFCIRRIVSGTRVPDKMHVHAAESFCFHSISDDMNVEETHLEGIGCSSLQHQNNSNEM